MPDSQIDSVRVTPAQALPGQPVLVEALAADGSVLDGPDVVINGIAGGRQFLQFDAVGSYRVHAASGRAGEVVTRSEAVTVAGHDAAAAVPQRFPLLVARRPADVRSPYAVEFTAEDTQAWVVGLAAAYTDPAADAQALDAAGTATTWTWDFGTGETVVSTSPQVQYDFATHLAVDEEHRLFDVTCDVTTADGAVNRVARTLSVVNAYALCRNRGVLALPVTSTSAARKVLKAFQASVVVRNPEAVPLTLTRRRFTWGDAGDERSTSLDPLTTPVVLAPGEASTLSVGVGFDVVPAEVRSFSVLWLGADEQGRTVHVEATLDVPLPDHRTKGVRYGELTFSHLLSTGLEKVLAAVDVEQVVDVQAHERVAEQVVVADVAHLEVARAERRRFEVDRGRLLLGGEGEGHLQLQRPGGGLFQAAQGRGALLGLGEQQVELQVERQVEQQVEQPVEQQVDQQVAAQVDQQVAVQVDAAARVGEVQAQAPARQALAALALDVVAEQAAPLGVNATISSSIGALLADDVASAVFVGAAHADAPPAAGRLALSRDLVELEGWAKSIQELLQGPDEGKVCDPDNLPDGLDDGWACQVVSDPGGAPEMVDWHRPARFANARKGDLVLAPGGPAGFIGGLLGQVTPPQRYAHMGIMTRNYDMITHCTFADERLKDHPQGKIDLVVDSMPAPTQGFEPDVLEFGWPGTITQWIGGATDTGGLADPQVVQDPTSVPPGAPVVEVPAVDPNGKTYHLAPFDRYPKISRTGESWQVVPPLVVKPDPQLETPQVRAALHRLADACREDTGKTHYSFFSYSDARNATTTRSTVAGAWHEGTYPAVCSSFVWAVARRLGLQLEGPGGLARPSDLEATDAPAVEVGEDTPDGLYVYTEQERTTAAHWFHERLRNEVLENVKGKVREKIGDLGVLDDFLGGIIDTLSDMADDVASQMCNAFASNDCSTSAKDSDAWQSPGAGLAVSPDDTMRWDGPGTGGLFGYAVPAVYLPPTVERAPKYAWHFSPTKGTVHGSVRVDGAPRAGALVQATDARTTRTGSDGGYRLADVPFGRYEIKAQFDRGDGVFYTDSRLTDVATVDQVVDFGLTQPRSTYRLVSISGSHYFMKHYVVGRNPRTDPAYPFAFSRGVTPAPDSMRATAWTASDFHGIYGVSSYLFLWLPGGAVQWAVNWTVCQDSALADDVAHAMSGVVDTLSLGFLPSLFGDEVKGSDLRTGVMAPGESASDSIRIGPDDGTTGLLTFRLQNDPL